MFEFLMNIALLGGAFNPPHIGHLQIAQQVLEFAPHIDEVWLLPNYGQNYYGQISHKTVAPAEERLAMLSFLERPHIKVSTLEIDNKLDGQTIHLLPHLPGEHAYSFIIGSDQLPSFHKWEKYQELLKQLRFIVIPRYGFANKPLYDNMTLLQHGSFMSSDVSSTKIRERVKAGLPIDLFVPKRVGEYIKENKLYSE